MLDVMKVAEYAVLVNGSGGRSLPAGNIIYLTFPKHDAVFATCPLCVIRTMARTCRHGPPPMVPSCTADPRAQPGATLLMPTEFTERKTAGVVPGACLRPARSHANWLIVTLQEAGCSSSGPKNPS